MSDDARDLLFRGVLLIMGSFFLVMFGATFLAYVLTGIGLLCVVVALASLFF